MKTGDKQNYQLITCYRPEVVRDPYQGYQGSAANQNETYRMSTLNIRRFGRKAESTAARWSQRGLR